MDENTMYVESGSVKISEDVVQTIAAMAINEVEGVSLPASLAEGFVENLVKKSLSKGIQVTMEEKQVSLELHVMVDYGIKIQPICATLQETVKRNIETMTDLVVNAVDVSVDGINQPKEAKKKEVKAETEE